MIFVIEIRCKMSDNEWNFKKCLTCEHFTCQKTKEGWTCSCAMNTDLKDNYHYKAIWQTELCILAGTMAPNNRLPVHIQAVK